MTVDFDRLLRDTVHELAAQGRPVDVTASALRRARRIRTRRTVAAAASVLVLLVGVGIAALQVTGDRHDIQPPAQNSPSPTTAAPIPSETATETPGSGPLAIAGGWLIRGAPARTGTIMYDERQGGYRLTGTAGRVAPSPNGQFLAEVAANTDVVIRQARDGQEVARQLNGIKVDGVYPVWSADSSRVAFVSASGGKAHLVIMGVDDSVTLSQAPVPCDSACAVKWLDTSHAVRVYTASSRVEVTVSTGAVGTPSAAPDDPCGYRVMGYPIDAESWLCVTTAGFAVTTKAGAVTSKIPFPTTINGVGVGGNINGYVLFRPK